MRSALATFACGPGENNDPSACKACPCRQCSFSIRPLRWIGKYSPLHGHREIMGVRSVLVAAGCSLLTGAGAVACFLKTSQLRTEAGWLMVRADAQAAEYTSTLDSAIA